MAIAFKCSQCEAGLKMADTSAGKKCKCPTCSAVIVVPGGGEEARTTNFATSPSRTQPKAATADEPRSQANKGVAKKGNKKMLLIGGLIVMLGVGLFACLGLGGGGIAIWYFYFSNPIRDETRYFPNDTQFVASVRVDQLRGSDVYKTVKTEIGTAIMDKFEEGAEGEFGVGLENIDRIVLATPDGPFNTEKAVLVVRTKKAVLASDLVAALKKKDSTASFTDTKVNGKIINEAKPKFPGQPAEGFCVVDSKLVLFGTVSTLKTILERDKAPEFSDKMKSALKAADFNKTFACAIVGLDDKKNNSLGAKDDVPPPESLVASLQVDKDVVGSATLTFKDTKTAEDAKTKIEKALADAKKEPTFKDLPSDLLEYKVKVSGKEVLLVGTVKGASVSKVVRTIVKEFK